MNEQKLTMLKDALEHRKKEVIEYQVNIDNFTLALELARQDETLTAFVKQLEELLASNIYEQKKAKIMLAVVEKQLKE
jgi:hypothetical protein